MAQNITLNLAILTHCNHPEFVHTCIWCVNAQNVYNKLKNLQEETKMDMTKVQILSGTGGNKLV